MFNEYPEIMSITDLRSALHIGRTKAYEMVRTGQIQSIRVGSAVRIPKNSLLDYVKQNSYNMAVTEKCPAFEGGMQ